jgi:D-inositol-3-phosphate glycosyltransferase
MRRLNVPVSGMVHSVNYVAMLEQLCLAMVSGLRAYDAMFCASAAARVAVEQLAGLVQKRMPGTSETRNLWPVRMPTIPYGVDTERWTHIVGASGRRADTRRECGADERSVVLLYCGRFSSVSKGDLRPLLLAFARLSRKHAHVRLVLTGDDSQCGLAPSLNVLAARLGCGDRVCIVPNPDVTQKEAMYTAADVFVSPSDSIQETLGLTMLDAMAAGLPIVASDWDGYKDLVVHGVNGFRVRTILPQLHPDTPIGDGRMGEDDILARTTVVDTDQLCNYLETLSVNSDLRGAMGAASAWRAKTCYDYAIIVGKYEEEWNAMMVQASDTSLPYDDAGNLVSYPYLDVFGHYGSEVLREDDLVFPGLDSTISGPAHE